MKPDILVAPRLLDVVMERLQADFTVHHLWEAAEPKAFVAPLKEKIRGFASFTGYPVRADLIAALPKLEIIATMSVGTDHIDLAAAKARGIAVTNAPDVLTDCVADVGMALVLAVARRITAADRFVREEARPVKLYVLLAILALATSMTTWTESWVAALAFFSWGMFIAVGFIVTSLHLAARAYPRGETGMVAGIGSGAWSAVVAILLPIYGRFFDHRDYAATFISLSLIPALGTALWWWIGRAAKAAPTVGAA